jgi:hypothetical protein
MRCDEVIRLLDEMSGERSEPALMRHLAHCESCTRRAEENLRLERLWVATCPAEPSPEAWEHLWTSVSSSLDRRSHTSRTATVAGDVASHPQARARRWRGLAAISLVGLAQAAALVLAIGLSWNGPPTELPNPIPAHPGNPGPSERTAPSLDSVVEVEEGQNILIRSQGASVDIIDLDKLDTFRGADPWYVFYNCVESASSAIAMTE